MIRTRLLEWQWSDYAAAAQGRGHKMEPETPVPFDGPADFLGRFFVEQWVTFPRFVLSGRWYRNLSSAGRPPR